MKCSNCKEDKSKDGFSKEYVIDDAEACDECGDRDFLPDWAYKCENCGSTPIVPMTGMCGPCTWGEAETAGGNW